MDTHAEWILMNKKMKGSFHWRESCFCCNNWILKGEEFYSIIIPTELRKEHLDLKNFIVHIDEWEEFSKGLSEEDLIFKILNYKKPKRKPLTDNQKNDIELFKQICGSFGFNKCVISKDKRFIKMKKRKTSFTLILDLVYDRISYDTNANEGLFGGLFSNNVVAKIRNKFYEQKGLDKRDDFTIEGVISEAVKQVDDLMYK